MVATFYCDIAVTHIKVLLVKLVTFISAHTMLIIVNL